MAKQIPVQIEDGCGQPYMKLAEQLMATPEETVAYMNAEFKRMQFGMIHITLVTEAQYAEWCQVQLERTLHV